MEIEATTSGYGALVWDDKEDGWVELEKCAACKAEDVLRALSHQYGTDIALNATVRGLDIDVEVIR